MCVVRRQTVADARACHRLGSLRRARRHPPGDVHRGRSITASRPLVTFAAIRGDHLRRDQHLTNKVLNSWYTKLAEEAGVRRINSHGARHTAGSSYAVMGAGQKVIASLLVHADTAATERYTHVGGGVTTVLVEARWAKLRG